MNSRDSVNINEASNMNSAEQPDTGRPDIKDTEHPDTIIPEAVGVKDAGINHAGTSDKILTRDLQVEIFKRNIWVHAVTALLFLCYFVLGTILMLYITRRNYYRFYDSSLFSVRDQMLQSAASWLGLGSYSFIITVVIAVIAGFASFYFVYNSRAVDFYFSQPVKRRRMFINIFATSILAFAGFTLVFRVFGILIAVCMKAITAPIILYAFVDCLLNILLFISLYALSALAVLVSRNVIIAVITDFILLAGGPLIRLLFTGLKATYFATYSDLGWMLDPPERLHPDLLSSIGDHISIIQIAEFNRMMELPDLSGTGGFIAASVLIGAVGVVLAYFAFIHRKAEDIGPGYVHPAIKNAAKFIVAIALTITAALIVDAMMDTSFSGFMLPFFIILAFTAFVSCMVIEVVCAADIKKALYRLWHGAVAAGAALLVLAIFKVDMTGYDSYVPDASQVESAAIFGQSYSRDYFDENGEYVNNNMHFAREMKLTDIEAVTRIAAIGQSNQRNLRLAGGQYPDVDTYGVISERSGKYKYEDGYSVTVLYRMKNGGYRSRTLYIPQNIDETAMNAVVGTDEYRSCLYDLDMISELTDRAVSPGEILYNSGADVRKIDASAELFEEFRSAYEKDIRKYDYSLVHHEYPVGVVEYDFMIPMDHGYPQNVYGYYDVYAGYDNTLAFLKKYDIYSDVDMRKADILGIDLYSYSYENDVEHEYDEYIEDPERIEEVLSVMHPYFECREYWRIDDNNCRVTLFTNAAGPSGASEKISSEENYYGGFNGFYIDTEDLPEWIK